MTVDIGTNARIGEYQFLDPDACHSNGKRKSENSSPLLLSLLLFLFFRFFSPTGALTGPFHGDLHALAVAFKDDLLFRLSSK